MAEFTTLKTLPTTTAAEAAPGTGATEYKTVPGLTKNNRLSRLVEFRLTGVTLAGAPTTVSFDIWRLIDGVRDYLGTWQVQGADITAGKVQPATYETWGNELMVTLSAFSGGSSPSFAGSIQARPLE